MKTYTKDDLIKAAKYGQQYETDNKFAAKFDSIEDVINDKFPESKPSHLMGDDYRNDFMDHMTFGNKGR